MSYLGLQVRQGLSVSDEPKVAYALMNGILLPQDVRELPKDLESALGAACQHHFQVRSFNYSCRPFDYPH